MDGGVELTAYLVNESRARRPDIAHDRLATTWIPEDERPDVRELWEEYSRAVYPHDDLVVSLRCRYILDTLAWARRRDPDSVLVVCGAGFTSYPWLVPFPTALEVDLPRIVAAKQRRVAELAGAGTLDERDVGYMPVDLATHAARDLLADRVRALAAGRPVVYVAEGVVFYLPAEAARAVAGLGAAVSDRALSVVSFWPAAAVDNRVLAAQRQWFRQQSVPEQGTHLTIEDLSRAMDGVVTSYGPEDLQRRYLGTVAVSEAELVPEHVAVTSA